MSSHYYLYSKNGKKVWVDVKERRIITLSNTGIETIRLGGLTGLENLMDQLDQRYGLPRPVKKIPTTSTTNIN